MNLRLVCTEGPRKGEEFLVKDGITLGRSRADLPLRDSKTSNPHAKIYTDPQGGLVIEDMASSNGTSVNGTKITGPTPIRPGDRVTLGRTSLSVEEAEPKSIPVESEKGSWQEKIELAIDSAEKKAQKLTQKRLKEKPKREGLPTPFQAPVVLDFLQGHQAGQTVVFGFGPRKVGQLSNDCLITEDGVAPVAFELHPDETALCELRAENTVQVNGAPTKSQKLKNGDRISVGRTVIVIRSY